jgi:hypothetical protein
MDSLGEYRAVREPCSPSFIFVFGSLMLPACRSSARNHQPRASLVCYCIRGASGLEFGIRKLAAGLLEFNADWK